MLETLLPPPTPRNKCRCTQVNDSPCGACSTRVTPPPPPTLPPPSAPLPLTHPVLLALRFTASNLSDLLLLQLLRMTSVTSLEPKYDLSNSSGNICLLQSRWHYPQLYKSFTNEATYLLYKLTKSMLPEVVIMRWEIIDHAHQCHEMKLSMNIICNMLKPRKDVQCDINYVSS